MISFMNTFFVASILICCLLVLMLIYNFRQRLNTIESNYKLTLDMLNNVVQKMAMIENGASGGYATEELNVPPYMEINEHQYNEGEGEESEGEESEGEESEGEESEGEESEGEESEGEESEGEESEGEEDNNVVPEFVMVSESEIEVDELDEIGDDNTISTEDGKEMALNLENEGELIYEKMSLTQLRALVKSRGLSSSVSKMKKADALVLLSA